MAVYVIMNDIVFVYIIYSDMTHLTKLNKQNICHVF